MSKVRSFWVSEYPRMNYQSTADGVSSIANKLGALLAHPVVRRAICEPNEPMRLRRLMDEGQGLLVSLAKGRIGVDVADVVGGLLVSSFLHAAYTRHHLPPADRRPFFLYVDEFASFTTTAFASMLSEARKYGLGVTLAHQYIAQAETAVIEAVLGERGQCAGVSGRSQRRLLSGETAARHSTRGSDYLAEPRGLPAPDGRRPSASTVFYPDDAVRYRYSPYPGAFAGFPRIRMLLSWTTKRYWHSTWPSASGSATGCCVPAHGRGRNEIRGHADQNDLA